MKPFVPKSVIKFKEKKISGAANAGNVWIHEVVADALISKPDGEKVLAYMMRRFGFPMHYHDDYKEMCQWILTTPMKGLYLSIHPLGGSEWGYLCDRKLQQKIYDGERIPTQQYYNRMKMWAKKEHGVDLFSTNLLHILGLPVEKKKDQYRLTKASVRKGVRAYNKWCEETNQPQLSKEDENKRFFKEFGEYKEDEMKKYRELYNDVEKFPEPTESDFIKKVKVAITATAQDLMKFTYVRDVYMNVHGRQNVITIEQAKKLFGEDYTVEYVNLNPSVKILKKYCK